MTVLIFLVIMLVAAVVGYVVFKPVGWWLFRLTHRHNPAALAFADREQTKECAARARLLKRVRRVFRKKGSNR